MHALPPHSSEYVVAAAAIAASARALAVPLPFFALHASEPNSQGFTHSARAARPALPVANGAIVRRGQSLARAAQARKPRRGEW